MGGTWGGRGARLLLAAPLLLLLAAPALPNNRPDPSAPPNGRPDPASDTNSSSQDLYSPALIEFYYESIYEPLFKSSTTSDGRRIMLAGVGTNLESSFSLVKDPRAFRIFVVGESVGTRFYETTNLVDAWRRLLPGRSVEFLSASVASYDSPRLLMRVKEVMGYEPDLLIIMAGNNENPDPASEPSVIKRFAAKYAVRSERLRKFQQYLARRRQRPAHRTPEEMLEVYRKNLTAMARAAAAGGVPVVFCALPRNLAGSPPDTVLPLWKESFFRAWLELERGDHASAEARFAEFQSEDPSSPLGYYARGLALLRLERAAEAAEEFRRAAERATKGIRPSMNAVLRDVAARENAAVADFEKALAALAPDGIPDGAFFDDEVHWHRSLNRYLNAVVLRAFDESRSRWAHERLRGLTVDEQAAAREEKEGAAAARKRDPKDEARRAMLNGVWLWSPDSQRIDEKSAAAFDLVYRLAPKELKRLLRPSPDEELTRTIAQNFWSRDKLDRLERIWPQVLDCLGETYRRRGRKKEAEEAFRLSLSLAPDRPLTRLRLALVELSRGREAAARASFDRARADANGAYPELELYGRAVFGLDGG